MTYRVCRTIGRFTTRYKYVPGTRLRTLVESGGIAFPNCLFAETCRVDRREQGRFQELASHSTQG